MAFLVTLASLRDDIAIALRNRKVLRDERSGAVQKEFLAQFGERRDHVEGKSCRAEPMPGTTPAPASRPRRVATERGSRAHDAAILGLHGSGGNPSAGCAAVFAHQAGVLSRVELRALEGRLEGGSDRGDDPGRSERRVSHIHAAVAVTDCLNARPPTITLRPRAALSCSELRRGAPFSALAPRLSTTSKRRLASITPRPDLASRLISAGPLRLRKRVASNRFFIAFSSGTGSGKCPAVDRKYH